MLCLFFFFFQAEDGIRDLTVTGVQTCAFRSPLARRGTAFHTWLENRFGATRLLDIDELPGAGDADASPDADLERLKESFRSEEHTSELQSQSNLVCRLLLEKKKK